MAPLAQKLITRRGFLAGSAGAGVAAVTGLGGCGQVGQPKKPSKFAIIHTNDTHGHDLFDKESLGLAAVAQLKADYEAQGYEVLLLDAGDAVQGDNLVGFSEGDAAIDFFNACAYDAMALGNHEFDYGQDKISNFASAADFPILSANVFVDATAETLVEPNVTFDLTDGTRVGVFALTTPETYTKAKPLLVQGLTILQGEELYACAQKQVDELHNKRCDLIICLSHLGDYDNSAPNRARDLVNNTLGIDLVIDGHDHAEKNEFVENKDGKQIPVVETGCYTHAIGVVTWEDAKLKSSLVSFGTYDGQNEEVAALVKEEADKVNEAYAEKIGETAFFMDGERGSVRTHETNLGDFVSDAVLWEAKQMAEDEPDCAIINGGTIRANIDAGEITLGDIVNVAPFINYLCTIRITGAQLLEAMEASCSACPTEHGGFPQVSAMSYTIDTRVPYKKGDAYPASTYYAPANPGSRVTIHDVGGRGFDLDETYTVAASDYQCAGGDTYYVFAKAAQDTMKTTGYYTSDCIRYYLVEACDGVVPAEYAEAAGQGRIEIIV